MKPILISLLLICSVHQNKSFIKKVSSDFNNYSFFIPLAVKMKDYQGRIVIQNGDFYDYLKRAGLVVDKLSYQKIVKRILTKNSLIKIDKPYILETGFLRIIPNDEVETNSKLGVDSFINIYFDQGSVLKGDIENNKRAAIIDKLFYWGIALKIDDETGYLILSR